MLSMIQLYRSHVGRVYRYMLVRAGDVQQAQSLTAQAFEAAQDRWARFTGDEPFAAWLMRIARDQLAEHARRQRLSPALKVAVSPPQAGERLQLKQVTLALAALPADCGDALALRVFAGLSAQEVGQVMGKSAADAKRLVYRAVRELQALPAAADEGQDWIEIEMKL